MISKELLSAVLNTEVTSVDEVFGNTLGFSIKGVDIGRINVYELANKCKEWAINYGKGYYVWTGINHNSKWDVFVTKFNSFSKFETVETQSIYNPLGGKETEPEAIFKACEWILEQEKQHEKDT